MQTKTLFFDPTVNRQFTELSSKPSDEEIRMLLADNNKDCPLSKVVVSEKNRGNMRILKRFAFNAFLDPFHSCKGMNFGIYAGPGQGKTFLVKQWAETIGIPFLMVQSDALESTWMLFELLMNMFNNAGTPLEPQDHDYHFALPPCIVFFDEAHALKSDLRTGGLLNAMEANDGWLKTKPSGRNQNQYEIDCSEVCWIAASTDPGMILKKSEAFHSRFRTHIEWADAGRDEVSQIVSFDNSRKVDQNPTKYLELPPEACDLVANYQLVPRKAIGFADQMILERRMMSSSWESSARVIAEDNGIDEYGMDYKIVELLCLLAKRPISDKNIVNIIGCRREEFDADYVPSLLADLEGKGPLAQPTSKGWAITTAGCEALDLRSIKHTGRSQLADLFL